MELANKVVDFLESVLARISENSTGKPLQSYCNLDTVVPLTAADKLREPDLDESFIYTAEDGSLITMFDLQGVFKILGEDQYINLIDELAPRMTPYCKSLGHEFWISYEQDPDRAVDEAALIAAPQIAAAKKMGLNVIDIIASRTTLNAARCHFEQNLAVIKTSLAAIAPELISEERKTKVERVKKHKQRPVYGQNIESIFESVKSRHETIVERFRDDFRLCDPQGGILLRRLSADEAARRYRIMIDRENTAHNYRPQTIGQPFTPRGNLSHIDDFLPPKLKWQLCSSDVEPFKNTRHLKTSKTILGNLEMEFGPQEEKPFSQLLANIDRSQPFRATFKLVPRGLDNYKLRKMISGLMGFTGAAKQTYDTINALEQIDKEEPVMGLQATFSTWADDEVTFNRRISALQAAIQSWGVCGVQSGNGDPVKHWLATVPAFSKSNPAPVLTPPLSNALYMMPFERPAAPFAANGWLINRTPDGKLMPQHLYPSDQDTWIEIYAGTPGSGKSLWLNTRNFHFMVAPGYVRLPMGVHLDVGSSSTGLAAVLRDGLPEHLKHQIQSVRLLNTREYATNVFDTQLGLRYPTLIEQRFQTDFLTLLHTDPTTAAAPAGVTGLLTKLIKAAYSSKAEGRSQEIYEPGINLEVDQCLIQSGIRASENESWWTSATWWEVVDKLFEAGFIREASLAQRQAVPNFTTISEMTTRDDIKSEYEGVTVNGQDILKYVVRTLSDAITNYPLLSGATRFELSSETRFVTFDLAAVIGGDTPEGRIQTGMFYLLGRHIGTRSFFLDPATFFTNCPELYTHHHQERIKDTQSEKKSISADEIHNFKGIRIVEASFEKDALQGRKLGIRLALASQFLSHYSPDILRAATCVYVMRGGSADDEKILRDQFGLNDAAITRLRRDCTGPTSAGSNFLAYFRTKQGDIVQILNNSSSAIELWAFNTNQLDMSLRNELSKRFGTYVARSYLAKKFPSGSAEKYLEKMRIQKDSVNEEIQKTVVSRLIETCATEIIEQENAKE